MKVLRLVAFEGNFTELKRLCREEGARVNEEGPETHRTALHWGALGGHTKIVSYLLKAAHAEVDPVDLDLNTPLNLVIQAPELSLRKKLAVIDILLAHHADATRVNIHGKTPLMNLENLRDHIPDSHYFQRRYIDDAIRRIKESIHNRTPVSVASSLYTHTPKHRSLFNPASTALRIRP